MRKNIHWCLLVTVLWGCQLPLTREEMREAVDESSVAAQASALTASSVEISTDFTIGEAAEDAAEEVRQAVTAALPCAEVSLADATLTIEYGAHPGNCSYRGHTLSGSHSIHVARNEMDGVRVEHSWDGLDNGTLSVTGTAEVTWSFADRTRHVVHELTWTRMRDGRMGVGSGDRLQAPLQGGIAEGFSVDGSRDWAGERGDWGLDIDGVQMRWADPVPQAGSYTLSTPFDKSLTLSFERFDEDSIDVTATGPRRSFTFRVNRLGIMD